MSQEGLPLSRRTLLCTPARTLPPLGAVCTMVLLWLTVSLPPVTCLWQTGQGLNLPIKNLRMEPERKILTWDINGNVSSIFCYIDSDPFQTSNDNLQCKFHVLPKCKASNYSINITVRDKSFITGVQYPKQEGNPGAAAEHLHCQVHDRDFLTCSWKVGREAPSDVQYSFSVEDTRTDKTWECPHYTKNVTGTHIQCQFKDISQFTDNQHRFLVSGTSKNSRIPCSELITYLSDIEKLIAPNLTANCNKSLATMEWEMSSHFSRSFVYELEIQQGVDSPFTQKVSREKSFVLTNPRTFTVRIRALDSPNFVGQWSAQQRLVCDQEEGAPVWLTTSLIALATLLTVGTAVLLSKRGREHRRYSVLSKLFPPIPHLKDPIGDNFQNEKMMAWDADRSSQEDCPVAQVQVLREM